MKRRITDTLAKHKISTLLKERGELYPSDLADALGLPYEQVINVLELLLAEGTISFEQSPAIWGTRDKQLLTVARSLLRDWKAWAIEQGDIREYVAETYTPTHGNCCTCRDCGHPHDECVCISNEWHQLFGERFNEVTK
jgi:hypothetical protein